MRVARVAAAQCRASPYGQGGVLSQLRATPHHDVLRQGDGQSNAGQEMGMGIAYRIANLRGFKARTGKSAKQMTKHARAPTLHPLKIKMRSHLLTAAKLVIVVYKPGPVTDTRQPLL